MLEMKKKGFTLVEILAVIVILGVIMTITLPKVLDIIQDSRNKTYEEQIRAIEQAAQMYVTTHSYDLDSDGTTVLALQDLADAGFIKLPVENPATDHYFSPFSTTITITKISDQKYDYDVYPVDE